MSRRVSDPARVYVRVMGTVEGLEWGFWLAATVWWIVILELSPLQLVAMGAVLELSVLISETPTGVVADLVRGQAMGFLFIQRRDVTGEIEVAQHLTEYDVQLGHIPKDIAGQGDSTRWT